MGLVTLTLHFRPLLLRLTDAIAATSTFKRKKNELKRNGYGPTRRRSRTSEQATFG